MKIVITGASGFIGSHLRHELGQQEENYVSAYERGTEVPECDVLIHCAGLATESSALQDSDYHEANVALTQRVFDDFVQKGGKTFVYLSSAKVYGEFSTVAVSEDSPLNPVSAYGRSKKQAEEYLREASANWNGTLVVLRPSIIYGAGKVDNLTQLVRLSSKLNIWFFGGLRAQRSLCSIATVVDFIAHSLTEGVPSATYNLADRTALSLDDLGKHLKEHGLVRMILPFPKRTVRLMAHVFSLVGFHKFRDFREKLENSVYLDTTKLYASWEPTRSIAFTDSL
jgi:nucleoside-diphosphate-sugar epimerase